MIFVVHFELMKDFFNENRRYFGQEKDAYERVNRGVKYSCIQYVDTYNEAILVTAIRNVVYLHLGNGFCSLEGFHI